MTTLLNVEFHCHTISSKDSLTQPEAVIATCRRKKIDRVVITDHNRIDGARRAKELAPEMVIVGEEIMTTAGELLAAFVSEEVPKGLPPLEAIARLREQGAFVGVSHPFDSMRNGGWKLPALMEITPLVDALETFNARCMQADFNRQAEAYARQHNLPGTAGSDAHAAAEIGAATLLMPEFDDPASLKEALRRGERRGGLSPWWVHFYSWYARWKKSVRTTK